jgi:hypothetical protein
MKMTTTETYNAHQLAGMAECSSPDSTDSPGARFLLQVAASVAESLEYDEDGTEDTSDMAQEVADSAVPIYTHERWQVFVDLCAYNEDISDFGTDETDLTALAGAALYVIAERLAVALIEEAREEQEDNDDDDDDDTSVFAEFGPDR